MARKVDMSKLLAKIAAVAEVDEAELKQSVATSNELYTYDESVMEMQSVINFYKTRIQAKEPRRKQNESKLEYTKRYNEYKLAYDEWLIRTCAGCGDKFAYSYTYEGVKYCSLDCLDHELRKIGLQVTYGRPLKQRWGLYHPGIVPASAFAALQILQQETEFSSESSE